MAEADFPYLLRKQQDAQRNKILRKLPDEKDGKKDDLNRISFACHDSFASICGKNTFFRDVSTW